MSTQSLAHSRLTDRIIHAFYAVYNELGYGFLESVYEASMAIVLAADGLRVERQAPSVALFRGQIVGEFRADLVVERAVVVELKAARVLSSVHESQLLNYLRSTDIDVGLLFNFGPRPSFRRLVYSRARRDYAVRGSGVRPENEPSRR